MLGLLPPLLTGIVTDDRPNKSLSFTSIAYWRLIRESAIPN